MKRKNELIDTHAHILNGIDDGADDIGESIAMARAAHSAGIKTIVATPHRIKGTYDIPFDKIKSKVNVLNKALKKKGVHVQVLPGTENYVEYDLDDRYRMNGKKYILLDTPLSDFPDFYEDIVIQLLNKGYIPIIAHPENNPDIMKKPKLLEELINKGCLVQLNAHSLVRSKGKSRRDFSRWLLKNNAYHILASNAHNIKGYEWFKKAYDLIVKKYGEEKAYEMAYETPNKVINGIKVKPEFIEFKEKFHTKFHIRSFVRSMNPF